MIFSFTSILLVAVIEWVIASDGKALRFASLFSRKKVIFRLHQFPSRYAIFIQNQISSCFVKIFDRLYNPCIVYFSIIGTCIISFYIHVIYNALSDWSFAIDWRGGQTNWQVWSQNKTGQGASSAESRNFCKTKVFLQFFIQVIDRKVCNYITKDIWRHWVCLILGYIYIYIYMIFF